MKPKMIAKICVDIGMTIALLLLMPYELVGRLMSGLELEFSFCFLLIVS